MTIEKKRDRRLRIRRRIRKTIKGTAERPRMSIFRSNNHIYVQLIDDKSKHTLLAYSSFSKSFEKNKGNKTENAIKVGEIIAEKAMKKGIKTITFDRGGYLYHGRVKALANAARKNGLKF